MQTHQFFNGIPNISESTESSLKKKKDNQRDSNTLWYKWQESNVRVVEKKQIL